jgi:hypothetical protein
MGHVTRIGRRALADLGREAIGHVEGTKTVAEAIPEAGTVVEMMTGTDKRDSQNKGGMSDQLGDPQALVVPHQARGHESRAIGARAVVTRKDGSHGEVTGVATEMAEIVKERTEIATEMTETATGTAEIAIEIDRIEIEAEIEIEEMEIIQTRINLVSPEGDRNSGR